MAFENPAAHAVIEVAAEVTDIGHSGFAVELHIRQHHRESAVVALYFRPDEKPYAQKLAAAINALLDVPAKTEAA